MKTLTQIAVEVTEQNYKDSAIPGISSMKILAKRLHIEGEAEVGELHKIVFKLYQAKQLMQESKLNEETIFVSAMVTAMSVGAALGARLEELHEEVNPNDAKFDA